ncbi:hypothetical protein M758_6G169500 [Ceratodon purpureus]|nr:hypothetical protein M758_6G169500 [Ceratodon purpureus]
MDSFGEDLNSPLPKRMLASPPEMMEGVVMERPALARSGAHSSTVKAPSEIEPRAVALRPLSERLGRITLRRAPVTAVEEQKRSADDLWSQLSDDMVEFILARLPLFPLKTSRKVCKRWEAIINTPQFENLHKELGEQQPWLVCYCVNNLVSSKSHGVVYDVESDTWITLPPLQFPSHNYGSLAGASGLVYAIAGPGEDRFRYMLTSSSTSPENFGETWYETPAMAFPRSAPVVSVALGTGRTGFGHKVVVAGGVPDFEAEHSAVEVFDSETGAWEVYDDLPDDFSESSSRAWMSGVVCDNKFYVSLIHSWSIHVLDLCTKEWAAIEWEHPQNLICHHVMAIGSTLVVAGLCGDADQPEEIVLKIWKVSLKSNRLIQIGLMPRQVMATLGRQSALPRYNFLMTENLLYVSNSDAQDSALVVGEVSLQECKTQWRCLPSLSTSGHRFDHMITFCSSISISAHTSVA